MFLLERTHIVLLLNTIYLQPIHRSGMDKVSPSCFVFSITLGYQSMTKLINVGPEGHGAGG
jgi:hypothetical protein